jgi:acyl-CoA thioester hydrolase
MHRLRRRVHFYETDAAGIVHFSTYFRFMEEAEHALWREAGVRIDRGAGGFLFPRVAANFEFHRPLRFEDEFDITIRIVAIQEKTIEYSCRLTRGEERIATGRLTVICTVRDGDAVLKASAIPADIARRFEVAGEDGDA